MLVPIHLLMILTNAEKNHRRRDRFLTSVTSCVQRSTHPVHLHLIGDDHAIRFAEGELDHGHHEDDGEKMTLTTYKMNEIEENMVQFADIIKQLMGTAKGYYGKMLFFVSMFAHRLFSDMKKLIQLDADIRCDGDIGDLWEMELNETTVMAIAYEQQPVYNHRFSAYRRKEKSSTLGTADGMRGFNTGVIVLDLHKMRASAEYNALLAAKVVRQLYKRYSFSAHLGDQCFYTLIAIEHANLIDVLSCGWNRQLCTWWLTYGGMKTEVFEEFHKCEERVNIWHGNCDTDIPNLDDSDVQNVE